MAKIEIYAGSILDVEADAIVNPANSFLRHGGGLARIIDTAARAWPHRSGVDLQAAAIDEQFRAQRDAVEQYDAENAEHPLIATGSAGWTSAGALPYKGIIHAVGPIWAGGAHYETNLVGDAYMSACAVAYANDCDHVAFPAISAGIFGVPIDVVASRGVASLRAAIDLRLIKKATVALMDEAHVNEFKYAMKRTEVSR